jgi:FAD/FMN-containing dehydrogenase
VFDAACLLISASNQQNAFPGIPGVEPDAEQGAIDAQHVAKAMDGIRTMTPNSGSYVNETDYFEPDWQQNFWGTNYPMLLEIKHRYDPTNLFRVHHGVGSES